MSRLLPGCSHPVAGFRFRPMHGRNCRRCPRSYLPWAMKTHAGAIRPSNTSASASSAGRMSARPTSAGFLLGLGWTGWRCARSSIALKRPGWRPWRREQAGTGSAGSAPWGREMSTPSVTGFTGRDPGNSRRDSYSGISQRYWKRLIADLQCIVRGSLPVRTRAGLRTASEDQLAIVGSTPEGAEVFFKGLINSRGGMAYFEATLRAMNLLDSSFNRCLSI